MKKLLFLVPVVALISLFAWHAHQARADVYGSSLLAWWTLDNGRNASGAGNVKDSAGTNNGTLTGSPTVTTGILAQALTFNGSSSYVDLGNIGAQLTGLTAITESVWVKTTTAADMTTFGFYNGFGTAANAFDCTINSNSKISVFARVGDGTSHTTNVLTTNGTSIFDGKWHHVVCSLTLSTAVATIYVDGVSLPLTYVTQTTNGAFTTIANSPVIGAENDNGSIDTFVNGILDDVRIYNRTLSAAEVQALNYYGISQHSNGNY